MDANSNGVGESMTVTNTSLVLEACEAALQSKIEKDHPNTPKSYHPKVAAQKRSQGCDIEVVGSDMNLGCTIGRLRRKGWRTEDHKRLTTQDPQELAGIFVGSLRKVPAGTFKSEGELPPLDEYRCWDLIELKKPMIHIFPSDIPGFYWMMQIEKGQLIYFKKPMWVSTLPIYLERRSCDISGTWTSTLAPPLEDRARKGYGQEILHTF
jgi:hypothetical protein